MKPLGSRPRYRANMSVDTPHLGEQNVFTTVAEDAEQVADRQEAQLAEASCWRIGGSVVILFMCAIVVPPVREVIRSRLPYWAASGPLGRVLVKYRPSLAEYHTGERVRRISRLPAFARLADRFPVVTFDVFDTLLQRNIEPPEYVKDRSARFAVLLVSSHGVAATLEQVKQTRNDEENRLRAVALSGGLDHECAIHEILHATLRTLVSREFADEHLTRWIEYELTSECEHLSAKPGAIDVLGRLKKAGKRIFLISDMYLRKTDLVHILRHAGLVSFVDDVFVSSEEQARKVQHTLV